MHTSQTAGLFAFPAYQHDHAQPNLELQFGGHRWSSTSVFTTYWYFAAERQEIFFRRLAHSTLITSDPILRTYKFTNAFRASDRVSQYLIRNVIYAGDQSPAELFFRIILFKLFNKIETWEALVTAVPNLTWREGVVKEIDSVLSRRREGASIYSGAYIMPSGGKEFHRKHRAHLALLENMMDKKLWKEIANAPTMQVAFETLLKQPMLGSFLAYQLVTDLNYSTLCNFSEKDFVVPGPGAQDGLRKCFPGLPMKLGADAIRAVCEAQESHFEACGLTFRNLWGRPLQLIDCQNLFCEVDKYSRVAYPHISGLSGRTRIKQQFRTHGDLPQPFYPPKWGLQIP